MRYATYALIAILIVWGVIVTAEVWALKERPDNTAQYRELQERVAVIEAYLSGEDEVTR